ncbi:MAG: hypothetical protein LBJ00_18215 [Planctomycetaceae bacterium]|nr:hypothetical protein [Planctomycetaceae bacterium]
MKRLFSGEACRLTGYGIIFITKGTKITKDTKEELFVFFVFLNYRTIIL